MTRAKFMCGVFPLVLVAACAAEDTRYDVTSNLRQPAGLSDMIDALNLVCLGSAPTYSTAEDTLQSLGYVTQTGSDYAIHDTKEISVTIRYLSGVGQICAVQFDSPEDRQLIENIVERYVEKLDENYQEISDNFFEFNQGGQHFLITFRLNAASPMYSIITAVK